MIWAAFSSSEKVELAFVNGRMNGPKYQAMLEQHLLPFGPVLGGADWIFQQDNAPCHASKSTVEWFQAKNVNVLRWPARSPDITPIENLWGIIVRRVYANGRQFDNVGSLKAAVVKAWQDLPSEILRNLVDSMKNRIFEVINKNGASTKY